MRPMTKSWRSRFINWKSKNGSNSRHIAFEPLEQRLLLTAAVGSFERAAGGGIGSGIAAISAVANGVGDGIGGLTAFHEQVLAHGKALVAAQGSARASATFLGQGHLDVPVGGTTQAPELLTHSFVDVITEGLANDEALASVYRGGTSGSAAYEFLAPPNPVQDMVFHAHLVIAGGIETIVSGDGLVSASYPSSVRASISIAGTIFALAAETFDGSDWDWTATVGNGVVASGTVQGALNLHQSYEIQVSSGSRLDIFTADDLSRYSESDHGNPPTEWFANGYIATAAAAWGYVTYEDEDVPDGDFDYDGDVDCDDFEIWQDGNFQADADLDGDVDDDDLAIWVANTDELVVSTELNGTNGNYSPGDLSLQEAITLAADANHPGHDCIFFDPDVHEINLTPGYTLCDSPPLSDSGGDRIMVPDGGPNDERFGRGRVAA